MKYIKKTLVLNIICMLVSVMVYFFNNSYLKKYTDGLINYFCKNYLNDIFANLVFIPIVVIILSYNGYKIKNTFFIMMIGIVAGMFWEYISPMINKNSVYDPLDLICYLIGTIIYCMLYSLNKKTEG